jgi:hypothetical protein
MHGMMFLLYSTMVESRNKPMQQIKTSKHIRIGAPRSSSGYLKSQKTSNILQQKITFYDVPLEGLALNTLVLHNSEKYCIVGRTSPSYQPAEHLIHLQQSLVRRASPSFYPMKQPEDYNLAAMASAFF